MRRLLSMIVLLRAASSAPTRARTSCESRRGRRKDDSTMRRTVLGAAALIVLGGSAASQLRDGDVVVSQNPGSTPLGGELWAYGPSSNSWSTVSAPILNHLPTCVTMDEANAGFLVPYMDKTVANFSGFVARVATSGVSTTLASASIALTGFELDHDGAWIGAAWRTSGGAILSYQNGVVTTLVIDPSLNWRWVGAAIDRDPGAPPYVVAIAGSTGIRLFGADRQIVTTLIPTAMQSLSAIALWPETGQYVCCGTRSGQLSVYVAEKDGRIAHTIPFPVIPTAVSVNKDGTAWVVGAKTVARVDLRTATLMTITPPVGPSTPWFGNGIETYGSRYVTCRGSGIPGTAVSIAVSSRKQIDAGARYQLACSLTRRPAITFPGTVDRLCLGADTLFQTSAADLLPGVFQNFRGRLDTQGVAASPIRVHIPPGLPRGLALNVFVSGVTLGASGIQTVFNTHWFEVN